MEPNRKSFERLRRHDLQHSGEIADGVVNVMASGGHCVWEIEKIKKAAEK